MRTCWPISRSPSKLRIPEASEVLTNVSTIPAGYGYRLFGAHDQRGDAERAVYTSPAVSRNIKNKKDIPWKEWRQNVS